ncbi:MAG: arsenate reductase ArsC [Deltaproteobacteria bacterium]|nr:arsenate reductase ArsC [Deltaproteobacteria bacterium]
MDYTAGAEGVMKSIVFVCIGNACRSQMAEGFSRHYAGDTYLIYSAGSHPLGFVVSETVKVMKEKGIDISRHRSKGINDLPDIEFDIAVLMGCGDRCPTLKAKKRIEWDIPDPVGRPLDFFRETRDLIEEKVKQLLVESFQ